MSIKKREYARLLLTIISLILLAVSIFGVWAVHRGEYENQSFEINFYLTEGKAEVNEEHAEIDYSDYETASSFRNDFLAIEILLFFSIGCLVLNSIYSSAVLLSREWNKKSFKIKFLLSIASLAPIVIAIIAYLACIYIPDSMDSFVESYLLTTDIYNWTVYPGYAFYMVAIAGLISLSIAIFDIQNTTMTEDKYGQYIQNMKDKKLRKRKAEELINNGFRKLPHYYLLSLFSILFVFIGSFLPWGILLTGFGQVSKAGISGDGVLTLILSFIGFGVLYLHYIGKCNKIAFVVSIIIIGALIASIGILTAYDISGIADTDYSSIEIGSGLYLTVIGGLGLILSGGWAAKRGWNGPV